MTAALAKEFWSWFSAEEPRLRAAPAREATGEIEEHIRALDSRIGVELGEAEVRELIFTVSVQYEAFDLVRALVAAAPDFEKWKVIALKPARGFEFSLDVGGTRIDASSLTFEPLDSPAMPGVVGLRVYVDDAVAGHPNAIGIVRLIVSTGIGEELAARVVHLEARAQSDAPKDPVQIRLLPAFLAWHDRTVLKN